jgi:hypothetical protein
MKKLKQLMLTSLLFLGCNITPKEYSIDEDDQISNSQTSKICSKTNLNLEPDQITDLEIYQKEAYIAHRNNQTLESKLIRTQRDLIENIEIIEGKIVKKILVKSPTQIIKTGTNRYNNIFISTKQFTYNFLNQEVPIDIAYFDNASYIATNESNIIKIDDNFNINQFKFEDEKIKQFLYLKDKLHIITISNEDKTTKMYEILNSNFEIQLASIFPKEIQNIESDGKELCILTNNDQFGYSISRYNVPNSQYLWEHIVTEKPLSISNHNQECLVIEKDEELDQIVINRYNANGIEENLIYIGTENRDLLFVKRENENVFLITTKLNENLDLETQLIEINLDDNCN